MLPSSYLQHIKQVTKQYHEYLNTTPRYERFMQGETLDEWITLLGPDVLLLTHANATANLTERFINYNEKNSLKLNTEEKTKLILAAWIHDWGEIIIEGEGIGDVSFENKKDTDWETETVIVNKILSTFDDEKIREEFHITYQTIAQHTDTKLSAMFNTIETLGYLETAITAYKGTQGKRITNWKGLCGNVLSNQIEKLVVYSKNYPFVLHILQKETVSLNTMFEEILNDSLPLDNTDKPSYDKLKLQHAYDAWRKFV